MDETMTHPSDARTSSASSSSPACRPQSLALFASESSVTIRSFAGLILLFTFVLSSSISQAIVLEVTDLSSPGGLIWDGRVFVPPGGTFTIGSRVVGTEGEQVLGLATSYYGYDDSLIAYDSAQIDANDNTLFGTLCLGGVAEFGGQASLITPSASPAFFGPLEGDERVRVFRAFSSSPIVYSLANSAGIDGVCGGGDADFRVTFDANAIGETVVTIGTGEDLGSVIILPDASTTQATNAEVRVYVPEPAFGLGLGLALVAILGSATRRLERT